jgi:hypothetical protein
MDFDFPNSMQEAKKPGSCPHGDLCVKTHPDEACSCSPPTRGGHHRGTQSRGDGQDCVKRNPVPLLCQPCKKGKKCAKGAVCIYTHPQEACACRIPGGLGGGSPREWHKTRLRV